MRTALVALVTFGLGLGAGWFVPRATPLADSLSTHWEGTIYLPVPRVDDPHLTEAVWAEALAEFLTSPFEGATLGSPVEGLWRGRDGKLAREPVRPVIVSFPTENLPVFRERVRILGQRLQQEAMYIRYDRPTIELHRSEPKN